MANCYTNFTFRVSLACFTHYLWAKLLLFSMSSIIKTDINKKWLVKKLKQYTKYFIQDTFYYILYIYFISRQALFHQIKAVIRLCANCKCGFTTLLIFLHRFFHRHTCRNGFFSCTINRLNFFHSCTG